MKCKLVAVNTELTMLLPGDPERFWKHSCRVAVPASRVMKMSKWDPMQFCIS